MLRAGVCTTSRFQLYIIINGPIKAHYGFNKISLSQKRSATHKVRTRRKLRPCRSFLLDFVIFCVWYEPLCAWKCLVLSKTFGRHKPLFSWQNMKLHKQTASNLSKLYFCILFLHCAIFSLVTQIKLSQPSLSETGAWAELGNKLKRLKVIFLLFLSCYN